MIFLNYNVDHIGLIVTYWCFSSSCWKCNSNECFSQFGGGIQLSTDYKWYIFASLNSQATETLFRMAVARGTITTLRNGEVRWEFWHIIYFIVCCFWNKKCGEFCDTLYNKLRNTVLYIILSKSDVQIYFIF